MDGFALEVLQSYNLEVVEIFTSGHICPAVYLAKKKNGKLVVVKTADTALSIQEIVKNLDGYKTLRELGLATICPQLHVSNVSSNSAYIIMEYCGKDVHSILETHPNPVSVYSNLAVQMEGIYRKSVLLRSAGAATLPVIEKIADQYTLYLAPAFGVDRRVETLLGRVCNHLHTESYQHSCFASWDFTPRNVCLPKHGLKYIDCNSNVVGIPIVDLACFAGVVRDVFVLPGSSDGYEILHELATRKVPQLLEIEIGQGEKLFDLGRTLQLFLSARFRIANEKSRAREFYAKGVECLEKICT